MGSYLLGWDNGVLEIGVLVVFFFFLDVIWSGVCLGIIYILRILFFAFIPLHSMLLVTYEKQHSLG